MRLEQRDSGSLNRLAGEGGVPTESLHRRGPILGCDTADLEIIAFLRLFVDGDGICLQFGVFKVHAILGQGAYRKELFQRVDAVGEACEVDDPGRTCHGSVSA